MSEILHKRQTKVVKIGNSLGFRVKKFYLKLAGMAEKDKQATEAIIKGKHGIFIGHWIPQDQPEINDINQKQLQKLLENKENEIQ